MKHARSTALLLLASAVLASPAMAGWKLMPAQQPVQVGSMTIVPPTDWNQAGGKLGPQGVAWTQDGFGLNGLELFAGLSSGQPLYRERSTKHKPMPKYDSAMLLPDLGDFFERSFRVQHPVAEFTIDETVPASFGGHKGVAVRYHYTLVNDELRRRGEARLATAGGRLFVANFYAPELHYFQAGVTQAETMMDTARF